MILETADVLERVGGGAAARKEFAKGFVEVAVGDCSTGVGKPVGRSDAVEVKEVGRCGAALADQVAIEHRFESIDCLRNVTGIGFKKDVLPVPNVLHRNGRVLILDPLAVGVVGEGVAGAAG